MDFRLDRRAVTVTSFAQTRTENPQLAYWLRRPPAERLAAVEFLRRQFLGTGARLRRVLRVAGGCSTRVGRDAFLRNTRAAGRAKDLADLEALRQPGGEDQG